MKPARTYKKHYPKGTGAVTPTVMDGRFRLVNMPRLFIIMKRAFGRYHRWKRHAARRRPTLLRPLTPGERTLLRMRTAADNLHNLLEPFRRTRPRGHEPLRELLHDAEARPVLVAQVTELNGCMDELSICYTQERKQLEGWIKEWDHATPERKTHIREVEKAHAISAQFRAFTMLTEEAKLDINYIHQLYPEAFIPAPAVAWPGGANSPRQSNGQTPYS